MSRTKESIPVINHGAARRSPKRSHWSKWRAASLIAVHLVFIAHVVQWQITGQTLSPVEPSESMETLETGRVNAGFIFFAVALAATLIFGRFVCGWGCHFIAYQDLCNWLLKKIGIRPKPLRSRLLIWMPLALAIYMFVWPTAYRWWRVWREPDLARFNPVWTTHFIVEDFWATFPGWVFAILTVLVAGFTIVYFLGSKGFCTYGCPYGGFFALTDRVAPVRVRVSDACDGSGVCTSVCTSNVRVAEEVARYGMVVDPGCMKCGDCVSACPNGALSVSAGMPAIFKQERPAKGQERKSARPSRDEEAKRATPAPTLPWREELFLLVAFGFFLFAWRGLYGGFPLLMSAGLAAILAYLSLVALRLTYRTSVTLQNLRLKSAGRLRAPGWGSAGLALGILLISAHSSVVQYHRNLGNHYFAQTGVGDAIWQPGFDVSRDLSAETRAARDDGLRHYATCASWSLIETVDLHNKLAWFRLLNDEADIAEIHARRALAIQPQSPELHLNLGRILKRQARYADAIDAFQTSLRLQPALEDAGRELGASLVLAHRPDEAYAHYTEWITTHPKDASALYYLGAMSNERGDPRAAIGYLLRAIEIDPDLAHAHYQLGLALVTARQIDDAVTCFENAVRLAPNMAAAHYNLAVTLFMQRKLPPAIEHAREASRLDPGDEQARVFLNLLLSQETATHGSEN